MDSGRDYNIQNQPESVCKFSYAWGWTWFWAVAPLVYDVVVLAAILVLMPTTAVWFKWGIPLFLFGDTLSMWRAYGVFADLGCSILVQTDRLVWKRFGSSKDVPFAAIEGIESKQGRTYGQDRWFVRTPTGSFTFSDNLKPACCLLRDLIKEKTGLELPEGEWAATRRQWYQKRLECQAPRSP